MLDIIPYVNGHRHGIIWLKASCNSQLDKEAYNDDMNYDHVVPITPSPYSCAQCYIISTDSSRSFMVKRASKLTQNNCATARAESPEPECFLVPGRVRKSARGFYRSVEVLST
jgi:hypothetical protein